MFMLRTLVLIAALALAGCASSKGHGYARHQGVSKCPAGTILICMPDTRRYCSCGGYLVR